MNLVTWVRLLGFVLCFSVLASCGGGGGSGASAPPPVNQLPRPVINVSAESGYAPLTVEFDGSGSSDSDGSIQTYTWHMGDGNSYAGSSVSHTYNTLDTFTATLTVTDDDGASASTSVTIDVYVQAAGPYWGEMFSDVTGDWYYTYGIIGSDNRIFVDFYNYSLDEWDISSLGNVATDQYSLTGSLIAHRYLAFEFADGNLVSTIDIWGTVDPRWSIDVTYSGAGDYGEGQLFYNDPIDKPASLEKIAGTWGWYSPDYQETMTVETNGSFISSNDLGCTFTGQFSLMDPKRNEYDVEIDVACPGDIWWGGNGVRTGICLIDDYYETDEWIYCFLKIEEGSDAGLSDWNEWYRPRTSGSSSANSKPVNSKPQRRKKFSK